MNRKFTAALSQISDIDFHVLEHHINVARMIRDAITRNGTSEKEMAKVLKVSPAKMKNVLNGSYPFDLRILASLQSYNEQIATRNARFKVEAESIGFVNYKDNYPIFVSKLDKLIEHVKELKNNNQQQKS